MLEFLPVPVGTKTKRWNVVVGRDEMLLGHVQWYAPWRRYCFYPAAGTLFDPGCLTELAEFCTTQNKEHQRELAEKRALCN